MGIEPQLWPAVTTSALWGLHFPLARKERLLVLLLMQKGPRFKFAQRHSYRIIPLLRESAYDCCFRSIWTFFAKNILSFSFGACSPYIHLQADDLWLDWRTPAVCCAATHLSHSWDSQYRRHEECPCETARCLRPRCIESGCLFLFSGTQQPTFFTFDLCGYASVCTLLPRSAVFLRRVRSHCSFLRSVSIWSLLWLDYTLLPRTLVRFSWCLQSSHRSPRKLLSARPTLT